MQNDDRLVVFLLLLAVGMLAYDTYLLWSIAHVLAPVLHLIGV